MPSVLEGVDKFYSFQFHSTLFERKPVKPLLAWVYTSDKYGGGLMTFIRNQRNRNIAAIIAATIALLPFQNCGVNRYEIDQASLSSNPFNSSATDNVDKEAPRVAILAPVASAMTRGPVSLDGTCESGLSVQLTVNGASPQSLTCTADRFAASLNLTAADGNVVLRVTQTDVAGNTGSNQVTVIKDTQAPAVQIATPAQGATLTAQALNVSGSCETGVAVNIAGTLLSAPAQVACANGSFQAAVSAVAVNGTYTLTASQTDVAGNQGSVSRNITLARSAGAPTIAISLPAASTVYRNGTTISGSCTNNLGVTISGTGVSASSNVNCVSGAFSAAVTFSAGDGVKNVTVSQTNTENLTGQDSRSFVRDATPPAITILMPAANASGEMGITVSGACEAGRDISVSGTGVAMNSTAACSSSSTYMIAITFSASAGAKVVTLSQTDAVGNVGTVSRTFQRIEPVLNGGALYAANCSSCHGGLEVSTKTNRTSAQISGAISSIAQMSSIRLSVAQIAAIETALNRTVVTPVACTDPNKLLAPQVKRLTVTQFANSVRNAFGSIFQDSQMPNLSDATPRIGLNADPDHLKIDEVNINGLYDSVNSLVTTIRASNTTVSSCITGSGNTCYDSIITSMGLRLWRRPLTTAELANIQNGMTTIVNAGASRQQRMDYVLKYLIMAPEHMYRSELGSSATPATAIFSLTQYEIASLLAFSVWDAPPDDTLLEAARTNSLSTKAQLKSQLSRMIANAQFTRKMAGFAMDVLKIEGITTVVKDASFGMTTADRAALLTSARTTLETKFASSSADFMAPFSGSSFHTNNLTARYFGMASTGLSSNFTSFNADSNQRYGMLSHPAFLTNMSGQVASGIVRRGVYALEQLLCNHLGTPPANTSGVTTLPPGWNPALVTSREELQVTHSSQAACIGCHQKIDPAGFGFENFGPFGQYRLVEKGNIPIDASGTLSNVAATTLTFRNSLEYVQALSQSQTVRQCMQKHFFKSISGESAATVSGQCEFSNFEVQISQKGASIQALIESYVELESFTRRNPTSQ